jgi:hypothetical protein
MLERLLLKIDAWQAKRSTEIAMLFICFFIAPAYIVFHLITFTWR